MALTNAEKQQRYRERHLGLDGTKQRGLYFLSVQAKAQLGRLARYNDYSITAMIEKLAAGAERKLLDRLGPKEPKPYRTARRTHPSPPAYSQICARLHRS